MSMAQKSEECLITGARRMATMLSHRGPDDEGVWVDSHEGVALAHRRLSILDLSAAGHQPMQSACGRYVLVFNGEIYNHRDLRKQLAQEHAYAWRGHSDTETLLAMMSRHGIEITLRNMVGMFALAVWDRDDRALYLARDRFGEKPLYYGLSGEGFVFASELRAIQAHSKQSLETDRDALVLLLRYGMIPAPYSIFSGIRKLSSASMVRLSITDLSAGRLPAPVTYWQARPKDESKAWMPFSGSEADALARLDTLLNESVAGQMLSDVPLGAFLSGGVDSSTVVALMQSQSALPVRTFTIGFHEKGYNEAEFARQVATHLGTEHTEIYVTPADALATIPALPEVYDEPFADQSQIPTLLVSRLAKASVSVSLSGDGGDELFGGYNRYLFAPGIWQRTQRLPKALRGTIPFLISSLSPESWNHISSFLPGVRGYADLGGKLYKMAKVCDAASPEALYESLVARWPEPESAVLGHSGASGLVHAPIGDEALAAYMMRLDTSFYLPNDVMTKVDRAAMSVSLETRAPLLDHRVAQFALSLPLSMKIREGRGKWILRQLLYRHVPESMIDRPKMGFSVPLDGWLRGPLREWAESLLCKQRLDDEGHFNSAVIRKMWEEHLSQKRNWADRLWSVLMYQAWQARQA